MSAAAWTLVFVASSIVGVVWWLGGETVRGWLRAAYRVLLILIGLTVIVGVAGGILYGIVRIVRLAWGAA